MTNFRLQNLFNKKKKKQEKKFLFSKTNSWNIFRIYMANESWPHKYFIINKSNEIKSHPSRPFKIYCPTKQIIAQHEKSTGAYRPFNGKIFTTAIPYYVQQNERVNSDRFPWIHAFK